MNGDDLRRARVAGPPGATLKFTAGAAVAR